MFKKIKAWAKNLKRQIFILYYACKDHRVPWYVRVFTASIVAYAFSPIDLIPDFIPILGYLDEVILLPLGIMLALKMIPKDVLSDCEVKAEELMRNGKQKNWKSGSIIILIWVVITVWAVMKIYPLFSYCVLLLKSKIVAAVIFLIE
ncbi:YkvA family protein [Bacillus salipaludis]|uniref:YkvA family protein n=1 Tax=Bacillus salipaludis TaxID=2547811 RepID=A0ABW8RJR9_9BACI